MGGLLTCSAGGACEACLCFCRGADFFVFVCWCVDGLAGGLSDAQDVSEGAEAVFLVFGHGWRVLSADADEDVV